MLENKGRVLGLDLGSKTLGIAISDLTQTVASPYSTLRFEADQYESLYSLVEEIIDKEQVVSVVLGFPKNMNNTVGTRGDITLLFQQQLQDQLNIEVVLQDERLSTKTAHDVMIVADMSRKKRKQKVDSLAAVIILQTYLDKKKGR